MFFPLLFMLQQLRATQPWYFFLVVLLLLIAGGVGWLIAAVLGFARSPAFGPSARWFSYAAVCLIIYHLQFLLFGVFVFLGMSQNSVDLSEIGRASWRERAWVAEGGGGEGVVGGRRGKGRMD